MAGALVGVSVEALAGESAVEMVEELVRALVEALD